MFNHRKYQRIGILLFLVFFVASAKSQLLDGSRVKYSEADSLRGALRPERTGYDVTFYELMLRIDTAEKAIAGSNKIFFKATDDIQRLQIDLFANMAIDSIRWGNQTLSYDRKFNAVFVNFPSVLSPGTSTFFEVFYHGKPIIAKRAPWDGGFTWTYDKEGLPWIGVSCEGIGASLWWPNKDHLSDEPDSMRIVCTVPGNLMFVGNGSMESHYRNTDQTHTYSWKVNYPINNYNVTLNIGNYVELFDEYDARDESILSLVYYVLPYNIQKAKQHFVQVKPMLRCYEDFLGKYPFWEDGYALVETPYLGMEHQGAIAYGNQYKTGYNGFDYSRIGLNFDYIIIHETGHEWWGNSVSCKDMADLWIHEGFCTYSEAIYTECLHGYDTALLYINAKKNQVGNKAPIQGNYGVNEEGDGDMYNKGMLMLHTLRYAVNDDKKWWALIKCIADTAFRHKTTDAAEIIEFIGTYLGKEVTPFFKQYLKHADIPVLEYMVKRKKGRIMVRCRWKCAEPDFRLPVYYGGSYGKPAGKIELTTNYHDFVLASGKGKNPHWRTELGYFDVKEIPWSDKQ